MSSSTINPSLARSRSLRVAPSNTLKPVTNSSQPQSGPTNIALFLTNLRLLDLDLRDDWPGISTVTFSTKDSQQNQKKRIQCVEWALYQLFALWDPEQARDKLQPFFPPLEPLQSLNLRAALFRCLDQAKKNGILGRDTVLRKTMLDECKGERLEEVLAVFSNVVLKKILQERAAEHPPLAEQLALENFSYNGERSILSALIVAHKASLGKHLRDKNEAKAKYKDFGDLLDLNERRITRRHEQLKQVLGENGSREHISESEVKALQEQVGRNWSGNQEWLETLLFGDSRANADGILATRFEKVWGHVEAGSIGDVEGRHKVGLLEQLDARVKDQENRLARWQNFGKTLCKPDGSSPSKKSTTVAQQGKIDLGFTKHQALQVGRTNSENIRPATVSLEEYSRLIENMKSELAGIGKAPIPAQLPVRDSPKFKKEMPPPLPLSASTQQDFSMIHDEEWSSASDTNDVISPSTASFATKSTSRTPPSEVTLRHSRGRQSLKTSPPAEPPAREISPIQAKKSLEPIPVPKDRSPSPLPLASTPPPLEPPKSNLATDSESDLADHILNSISAASPSPKKTRHTLSLAERTRLSMSRASHSRLSDLHDEFEVAELPRLTIKSRPSMTAKSLGVEQESDKHADLIERTRKSMAGFEAAQKKAQLERRQSVKDAKKKQRESSYFPKVEEESVTPDISAIEMLEGDPDYESVFKSRPKIKTSPAVSPTRIWEESEE